MISFLKFKLSVVESCTHNLIHMCVGVCVCSCILRVYVRIYECMCVFSFRQKIIYFRVIPTRTLIYFLSFLFFYISHSQFKNGLLSSVPSGDSPPATSPPDITCIDELKRAFELVEVSSPGISDQLLTRIYVHLQHRYNILFTTICMYECTGEPLQRGNHSRYNCLCPL